MGNKSLSFSLYEKHSCGRPLKAKIIRNLIVYFKILRLTAGVLKRTLLIICQFKLVLQLSLTVGIQGWTKYYIVNMTFYNTVLCRVVKIRLCNALLE